MTQITFELSCLTKVLCSLDEPFVRSILATLLPMMACVRAFGSREIDPAFLERFERRIEKAVRELGRLVIQQTLCEVETRQRPGAIQWEHRTHRPRQRVTKMMETRLGTIHYHRWFFEHDMSWGQGSAPLDHRFGLMGLRSSPGVAHKQGRLAADFPQQSTISLLREEFDVSLSVEAYRRAVDELSIEINYLHDDLAISQLAQWMVEAQKRAGKHEVLLLAGRDGVHVPMRRCWKEAACATLAIYDRNRKRLGTIYLGQMPQKNQATMTERLEVSDSGDTASVR